MLFQIEDLKKKSLIDTEEYDIKKKFLEFYCLYDGYNCLSIIKKNKEYPMFIFAVSNNYATVNYFSDSGNNYVSKNENKFNVDDVVIFYMISLTEEQEMSKSVTISVQDAIDAAIEFMKDPCELPSCIMWYEL
ncbi:Imm1 family immunity protein [Consotaella aegiceratis]|uniref:Imm1 family immunity protein n=1 Tax=Consotaella aegiceratis TaxID=3097961 RepID=UPI002F3E66E2